MAAATKKALAMRPLCNRVPLGSWKRCFITNTRHGSRNQEPEKNQKRTVKKRSRRQSHAAETPKLANRGFGQRTHNARRQQVDRIPDTSLRDETKYHCDNGHRDRARKSAPQT